jgi:hypothetical protein
MKQILQFSIKKKILVHKGQQNFNCNQEQNGSTHTESFEKTKNNKKIKMEMLIRAKSVFCSHSTGTHCSIKTKNHNINLATQVWKQLTESTTNVNFFFSAYILLTTDLTSHLFTHSQEK